MRADVPGWRAASRILLAYPAAILRIYVRDRAALFFSFLLPVALIVVIGLAFGSSGKLDVGVVDLDGSALSGSIVEGIEADPAFNATRYVDEEAAEAARRRNEVVATLVIPAGTGAAIEAGDAVPLVVVAQTTDSQGTAAALALQNALAPVNASVTATRAVEAHDVDGNPGGAASWDETFAVASGVAGQARSGVEVVDVGGGGEAQLNRFSLTASQNLVLFVFTTAMMSAAFIVAARRHGVLHRSLSTRAASWHVVGGILVAIFVVTLAQSAIIVVIGSAVFQVDWGDPIAVVLLVVITDLAAAAAGVLVGAVGRNPDRTAAMAPVVGVGLAVIGGCIIPLELFPDLLAAVAHVTPQFWAVRAWQSLMFDGVGAAGIGTELLVLAGVAVALGGASVRLLGRQLARARV